MAGWNLLYLQPGPWRADPAHDATWNRGRTWWRRSGIAGLPHAAQCARAEEGGQTLAGGEAENWYAPPLQAGSVARQPWTEDSLAAYLRTGFDAHHGAAAGPMTA